MFKLMKHSDILETTSISCDFTKHGLHLNMNGKERMFILIGKKIITKECTTTSHPTAMVRQLCKHHRRGRRKTHSDQYSVNSKHCKQVLKETEKNTSNKKQ